MTISAARGHLDFLRDIIAMMDLIESFVAGLDLTNLRKTTKHIWRSFAGLR